MVMRARLFRVLYLTAVAVTMMGWVWMIVEGIEWVIA
jgi:hypothetical protein